MQLTQIQRVSGKFLKLIRKNSNRVTAKLGEEKLPLSRSSGKRKLEPQRAKPCKLVKVKLVARGSWVFSTPPWGQAFKSLGPTR